MSNFIDPPLDHAGDISVLFVHIVEVEETCNEFPFVLPDFPMGKSDRIPSYSPEVINNVILFLIFTGCVKRVKFANEIRMVESEHDLCAKIADHDVVLLERVFE